MRPPVPPTVEALLAHTGFVRDLARRALGREDGSDDVAQEAWVAALEHGPQAAPAARAWFGRVVRNHVISQARRQGARRRHLESLRARPPVPTPDEILAREEARRRLVAALLELDPLYREPLVLRYYEDLPPREVARRLGVPVETVRTRLKRGIRRLRARLDTAFGDRGSWIAGLLPLTRLPRPSPTPGASSLAAVLVPAALAVVAAAGTAALLVTGTGFPRRVERSGTVLAATAGPSRGAAFAVLRGAPPAVGLVSEARPKPPTLRSSWTIRIVDEAGSPVEAARVRMAERRGGFTNTRDVVRGPADAAGCLEVPRRSLPTPGGGYPEVSYLLEVRPPEGRPDLREVLLPSWDPQDATLVLPRSAPVDGSVVDRDGAPVAGARVVVERPRAEIPDETPAAILETDEEGRFAAPRLPPGRWRVRVEIRTMAGPTTVGRWEVQGGSRALRLAVDGPPATTFRVLGFDESGRFARETPLVVTAYDPATGKETARVRLPLDAGGRARIHGLRRDRRYALWWNPDQGFAAYEPAFGTGRDAPVLRPAPTKPVRVRIVRPRGWDGWLTLRARGLGFDASGTWASNDLWISEGLPPTEVLVTAEGGETEERSLCGEVCVGAGGTATLVLHEVE